MTDTSDDDSQRPATDADKDASADVEASADAPPTGSQALHSAHPQALAVDEGREGSVGMYAAAAGVLSALPVPFLDSMLASLARGAAMRRVAQRHGVRLDPAARDLLARGDEPMAQVKGLRIVRSLAARFVAPLRLVNRAEEALSAFSAASLFDHYLRTADRRQGAPLTEAEARRVHQAMKGAAGKGATDALKGVPLSVVVTFKAAVDAARAQDAEGRPPVERVVDALLDSLADAPDGVNEAIERRFDEALAAIVAGRAASESDSGAKAR